MATKFQWVQMILKNHAGVIALWVAIFGITGYTAYRDTPRAVVAENTSQAVSQPIKCICDTAKLDSHIREYKEHMAKFH